MKNKNVHTEHCCVEHGCKYGDLDCPVWLGYQRQSYPCEDCGEFTADSPWPKNQTMPNIPKKEILEERLQQLNNSL